MYILPKTIYAFQNTQLSRNGHDNSVEGTVERRRGKPQILVQQTKNSLRGMPI